MKKLLALYTPVNPTRPHVGRLRRLHEANVKQNDSSLFDYFSEEVMLPPRLQEHGLWRGQNVIHHFNQFYLRIRDDYEFICKWDDDMILPPNILTNTLNYFDTDPSLIGCGLFQEDYGKPWVLMEDPLKGEEGGPIGWYGAFSRFYIYRMSVWGVIPVEAPWLHNPSMSDDVSGKHSGDPDNAFQCKLKGKKHILDVPSIHFDHRALPNQDEAYRVLLDIAAFFMALLT